MKRASALRLLPLLLGLITAPAGAAVLAPGAASPDAHLARGRTALTACAEALERRSEAEAAALADEAEAAFEDARPGDPLAADLGLAKTLLQCRIEPAPMMEKVALTGRIEAHLQAVLALDPDHREGHFLYGVLLYHLPPFLGRTDDAIGHLSRVLELGPGAPPPAYLYLGELHQRAGRPGRAQEVWRAGATAHPEDPALAERLAPAAEPPEPPGSPGTAVAPPPAAGPEGRLRDLAAAVPSPAVPGVAVGLARGDEVLLLDGFGLADVENRVPMTADHVLRIGSVSKQFAAVLALRLAEAGRLSVDDPVARWLPGHGDALEGIRVRHLLTHTSGLPRDATGTARWLEESLALGRSGAPGERYEYSNLGYALLGRVAEAAGGAPHTRLLEDWVLEPAGLAATAPCDERAVVPRRAQGYAWRGGALHNDDRLAETPELSFAGGLCSTARDLLRWLQVLHGGGFLSAESYRQLVTPPGVSDPAGTTYAAGLQTVDAAGRPALRHSGAVSGFVAETVYRPEARLAVVVLANGEAADPRRTAAELLDAAAR